MKTGRNYWTNIRADIQIGSSMCWVQLVSVFTILFSFRLSTFINYNCMSEAILCFPVSYIIFIFCSISSAKVTVIFIFIFLSTYFIFLSTFLVYLIIWCACFILCVVQTCMVLKHSVISTTFTFEPWKMDYMYFFSKKWFYDT